MALSAQLSQCSLDNDLSPIQLASHELLHIATEMKESKSEVNYDRQSVQSLPSL